MSVDAATLDALVEALRAAGRREVMPRFRRLAPEAIRAKSGPLDLVTAADEAAERLIGERVRAILPDALLVGEEATAADPSLLDRLGDARQAVVIDPIDGTANYVAGLPLFGIMAAVIEAGETVAAAIHDPVCDDTAVALRGEGARLVAADGTARPLRVAAPVPPEQSTGSVSYRYMPEPMRSRAASRLPGLATNWELRCAAHAYRMVASGACHHLVFHRLMPWDHAAGVLLHEEAGGSAMGFDGAPYRVHATSGGLVCAGDRGAAEAVLATLLTP